jgi:hypothetical protein
VCQYGELLASTFYKIVRGGLTEHHREKSKIKFLLIFMRKTAAARESLQVEQKAADYCNQCCGSEKIFFGFGLGSLNFLFGFGYGFGFYRSGKGIKNFLKYRQSVFHEDVLIKLKFLPA